MNMVEFWLAFVAGAALGQVTLLVLLLVFSGAKERSRRADEEDEWEREADVQNMVEMAGYIRDREISRH